MGTTEADFLARVRGAEAALPALPQSQEVPSRVAGAEAALVARQQSAEAASEFQTLLNSLDTVAAPDATFVDPVGQELARYEAVRVNAEREAEDLADQTDPRPEIGDFRYDPTQPRGTPGTGGYFEYTEALEEWKTRRTGHTAQERANGRFMAAMSGPAATVTATGAGLAGLLATGIEVGDVVAESLGGEPSNYEQIGWLRDKQRRMSERSGEVSEFGFKTHWPSALAGRLISEVALLQPARAAMTGSRLPMLANEAGELTRKGLLLASVPQAAVQGYGGIESSTVGQLGRAFTEAGGYRDEEGYVMPSRLNTAAEVVGQSPILRAITEGALDFGLGAVLESGGRMIKGRAGRLAEIMDQQATAIRDRDQFTLFETAAPELGTRGVPGTESVLSPTQVGTSQTRRNTVVGRSHTVGDQPLRSLEDDAFPAANTVDEKQLALFPDEVMATLTTRESLEQIPEIAALTLQKGGNGRVVSAALNLADAQFPKATRALRRQLRSRGLLPEDVFQETLKRDFLVNTHVRRAQFIETDFRQALAETYGVKTGAVSDDQIRLMDQVLQGERDVVMLPPRMREPVMAMRRHADDITTALIDGGYVSGDMAARLSRNRGLYLTRTYERFENPNWANEVPVEARNKVEAIIRQEFPDWDDARVQGELDYLVRYDKDGPLSAFAGQEGVSAVNVLMKRGDFPEALQEYMGRIRDPLHNYARTVTRTARLLETDRLMRELSTDTERFIPKGQGPLTLPDGQKFTAQVPEERQFGELAGAWVTDDMAQGLNDAMRGFKNVADSNVAYDMYMTANGFLKMGKTVFSPQTHVRNMTGNIGFAITNGHLSLDSWSDFDRAFGAAFRTAMSGEGDEGMRGFLLDAQKYGVISESAVVGDLEATLREGLKGDNWTETLGRGSQQASASALRQARDVPVAYYRAEDDVWKLFGWLQEQRRYSEAMPGADPEQIAAMTANIVRDLYPTYSLVPRVVQGIRRVPFMGPFVAFSAEVGRTANNLLRISSAEIKSTNPAIRQIGWNRVFGGLMAAGGAGTAGMALGSRLMHGITRQEDEDMRQFLPEWSRNSTLLYLGKNAEGETRYIDIGYTDPHSYLKKPLMAFIRGQPVEQAIWESVREAAAPFVNEEILSQRLIDVHNNRRGDTTRKVFNDQLPWEDRFKIGLDYIWDGAKPGFMVSAERIASGMAENVNVYGDSYDATDEALAVGTGMRMMTFNPAQALDFKVGEFVADERESGQIITDVLRSRGDITEDELVTAMNNGLTARRNSYSALLNFVDAARNHGKLSEEALFSILHSNNAITADEAGFILAGMIPPLSASGNRVATMIEGRVAGMEPGSDQFLNASEDQQRRILLWESYRTAADNQLRIEFRPGAQWGPFKRLPTEEEEARQQFLQGQGN